MFFPVSRASFPVLVARFSLRLHVHFLFRKKKLKKAGTVDFKKHPARKVRTRSGQCRRKVRGRFAFPGARNPRICSISRFGKTLFQQFSRDFPGVFLGKPHTETPETARAFSSFLIVFVFSADVFLCKLQST